MTESPKRQESSANSNSPRRILMEQLFWGMLGPLIPNVVLMVGIYNAQLSEIALAVVVFIYWLLISGLIGYMVIERARRNEVAGEEVALYVGALIGTLLVVIYAQVRWTIFATFQEDPVSAFLFILLSNLLGTAGALLGFYSKQIRALI